MQPRMPAIWGVPYEPVLWMLGWTILMAVPFAIGNYFLARRVDGMPWLWAMLTLIPILNYLFCIYVAYRVLCAMLDRLDVLRLVRGKAGA